MNNNFIKELWLILKKYLSEEKIISKTKNPNNHKKIEKIETDMNDYWLNSNISISTKEDAVARWIEKFLNNQELFNYNLDLFGDFYNEIDIFLSKNDFRIDDIPDELQTYFKVVSPTYIEVTEKMYEELGNTSKDEDELRKKIVNEKEFLVAKQNQRLLISFIENSEIYLKILKEYFDNNEIIISKQKQFVKSVVNMRDNAYKLALGISGISYYNFDIILPFGSLYLLKEDWDNAVKKDKKRDRFFDFPIIKKEDFTFENIQSILAPTLNKVSSLINDELIQDNDVNRSKYKRYTETQKDTTSITLSFDKSSGILTNSLGAKSQPIIGQSLRLLMCFLESKSYTCKNEKVIKSLGGKDAHGGAKRQLLSLIHGVADIESIRNKKNKRNVDFYRLIGVKN